MLKTREKNGLIFGIKKQKSKFSLKVFIILNNSI